MDEDSKDIKIDIDLDWFDKLLANTNGITQYDLFKDDDKTFNIGPQGASGNVNIPWNISVGTGTGGYSFNQPNMNSNGNFLGGYGYSVSTAGAVTLNDTFRVKDTTLDTSLKVIGDAEFEGDVKIKGKNIIDMFEKIEDRLAILHPNEELEAKWEQLRELRRQYIELEKDILEKEKIWNILKK